MTDNTVEILLNAKLDGLRSGMRDASRVIEGSMAGMRRQMEGFRDSMSRMRNVVAASGLTLLGKQAVTVMSSFEQLEIRLKGVMGSVEGGEKAFAWIKDFATKTPYEVGQVADSFMRLKAFGLDPMDGTLQALADTAGRLGGGYQTLEGVSLALGQAWAKQKLQGEEILQLVERGVPVWDLLEKVTGKNTTELAKLSEQGALGREVISALVTELGNMNAGASNDMMDSLSGKWSNMVDNIKNSLDDLRNAGGLNSIKGLLDDVNKAFDAANSSGNLKKYAEGMAITLSQVADIVREMLNVLRELLSVGVEVFSGLGAAASDSSDSQTQALTPLGTLLEGLRVLFIGFGVSVRLVWHTLKFGMMEFFAELETLGLGFSIAWDVLVERMSNSVTRLGMRLDMFGQLASKALKGDFTGVAESWRNGTAQIEAELEASRKRIEARQAQGNQQLRTDKVARKELKKDFSQGYFDIANDGRDRINREGKYDPFSADLSPTATKKKADSAGAIKAPEIKAGGTGSQMSAYKNELSALQSQHQLANQLRAMSLADELAFWEKKKTIVAKGSADAAAIDRRMLELQVQMAQATKEQDLAVNEARRAANQKLAEQRISMAEQQAQAELDIGLITQAQFLEMSRQFEAQRYEISRQGLEDRQALLALEGENSRAATEAVKGELELLEQEHNQRKAAINNQALVESMSLWTELGDSMSGLWDKGLQSMMNGTLTWKNALSALWADMARVFLTRLVSDPLKQWLAMQATKLAAKAGFLSTETAMDGTAAATGVGIAASAATAKIAANAAVAGSGAASSQASIPYVGPILAIAAMGAIFAAVSAMKGNVKSARGGYDIPAGVNPMTQLHEQEMVLPAEHANTIRQMSEGGGGEGGGLNVSFAGVRMGNFFLAQEKDFVNALKQVYRKGAFKA